jgi:CheY-like chemotaxis protein
MITGYFEHPPCYTRDLLWRTADSPQQPPASAVHADVTILMINPALPDPERQTRVVTPAQWTAHIVEVSDPLDGLVRAAEIQPDMLVIDLDTPTFDIPEVLRAVKRSSYFDGQITLAVATDLAPGEIPGQTTWPPDVMLLRRSAWLQALQGS